MKLGQILSFSIIILFYILYNMMSLNSDMNRNKMLLFGLLALLGMVVGLFLIVSLFSSSTELIYSRKQITVAVLLLLFTIVSSLLFAFKGGGVKAILMLISCFGAIIVGLVNPLKDRRLSALLISIIAAQQFNVLLQGLKNLVSCNWWFPAFNVFFSSTNGTAQFAAASIAVVLLVYSQCEKRKGFLQTLFITNLGIGTMIILFSASRGGILAILLAAIYWLWKTIRIKEILLNKKTYKYILVMILLLLIINNASSFRLQLTDYFTSISKIRAGNFLQSKERGAILKEALGQITSSGRSFIWGQDEIFTTMPQTGFWHAHNSYVEIVRNLGIFPLLILLLLLLASVNSGKSSPYIMMALMIIMTRAFFDDTLLWTNFGEFFLMWPIVLLTYKQPGFNAHNQQDLVMISYGAKTRCGEGYRANC